ncbi:MAG: hypothetical protein VYD59_05745, partial [Bacteroidota bacterium]|nr:hypothetical protein [Bacteroidota bacterium]
IFSKVKQLINSIEIKMNKLIDKYNQLKIENTNLLKNNNDLQLVLDEKNNKILDLQNKVKLMNITKNVDRDKDEIRSTRLKINEYVREIDKCIALLNN